MNMPAKTKRDEEKWSKAKSQAKKQGRSEDYAYIMGIYKNMKPDYFKESIMQIREAKLRRIIREELQRIKENIPTQPFDRAGRRFLDAVDKKGIDGALRDTMLRVDRIGNPSKAMGVVKYMTDYLKSMGSSLNRVQKRIISQIIRNAKAKAA